MEQVLLEAVSRHEGQEESQEKPIPTSANSALFHCQEFTICFITASIETWEADLTHEDQGKEGMKENRQVFLYL